ncbi:uncharacterized protein PHACADRAFT_252215 [Phanerochaete carnosa HHB-10118-sp]|uniref:Uncharacterized protein n=1 Tax=Phanerochaete carnosa (strain HHB-10118-sp) TaxID=650164 RepID=K5X5K4_PHACS|nr:uncharacterized protein PHACADRAFT_252215 [Phanerochaete carnosa HHB-10118-sp]EKM58142.1 hypothetical protein PHACADRAFT_252215 [Phanerochaete carnosa HHB-10118-sp]
MRFSSSCIIALFAATLACAAPAGTSTSSGCVPAATSGISTLGKRAASDPTIWGKASTECAPGNAAHVKISDVGGF